MGKYEFLVDTYDTERVKTLSVWSQIPDARMRFRPDPRARTPLEHMVHQSVSEDAWMKAMLGIAVGLPALPAQEVRLAFIRHYAACSAERLRALGSKPDAWFEELTQFFDVPRSRAWVLTRRFTHSAHHRGQLTGYLRLWGEALYSTFGPTADTGGLPKNGARAVYRYASVEDLLDGEAHGGRAPSLPGAGALPVTERPSDPREPTQGKDDGR
ncbi:MAG: damage-inducible protein DinB [Betaproteobacteria bacterium RIFCSPLOWO2_02_FULL_62_17]|nr:MAG: damage-inducible protein DinB [Betaproteobacteria bacterium RIFCSPLOWO2_02_FULL_62_17]